jgi:signal transduction histidine kinase
MKISSHSPDRAAAGTALRNAGIGVLEIEDWDQAAEALRNGQASVLVCDQDAISALTATPRAPGALPRDLARSLSHELRTPLSAMAGWLHLMDSGKLDEAGMKRAIGKLRGNIDDQVRTIDRYLGANHREGQGE